jgi:hypothetical protein
MGTSVEFLLGSSDGITGHFLSGPLVEFHDWYSNHFEEYLGMENDSGVTQLIDDVLLNGQSALAVMSVEQAIVVDKMMSCYYGHFCDYIRPDQTVHAFVSFVKVAQYEPLRDFFKLHCHPNAVKYMTYLLDGRGVGRRNDFIPYQPEDDVFRLGYWTITEVKDFLQCLSQDLVPQSSTGVEYNIKIALQNALANNMGIITLVA